MGGPVSHTLGGYNKVNSRYPNNPSLQFTQSRIKSRSEASQGHAHNKTKMTTERLNREVRERVGEHERHREEKRGYTVGEPKRPCRFSSHDRLLNTFPFYHKSLTVDESDTSTVCLCSKTCSMFRVMWTSVQLYMLNLWPVASHAADIIFHSICISVEERLAERLAVTQIMLCCVITFDCRILVECAQIWTTMTVFECY